jgi:hypothetical protein
MARRPPSRAELLRGTLDLLILRTLLPGPSHGHAIAKHIQRTSEDLLQVENGLPLPGAVSARGKTIGWPRRGSSPTRASALATIGLPRAAASS